MTVTERFDLSAPTVSLEDLGRVHVTNVGGAGMSAVARVLLGRGVAVSGSDPKDLPVLAALREQGADVHAGAQPDTVDRADTVVVSSATRESDPELVRARQLGTRVLHRSQALASAAEGRRVVAVAGANGKTTTTSMLTALLLEAGADPSFAIGGELARYGTNARAGSGEAFVIEADESDGSFLVYHPEVAIVTNVQPDHLDHYGTFEAVQDAYLAFARSIRPGGLLVACADDEGSARLARRAQAEGVRVLTYGTSATADVRVVGHVVDGFRTVARIVDEGQDRELSVAIPGAHNVLNATAAYAAAHHGLGVDASRAAAGLAAYTGTRRRFELKGEAGGVTVVDDYAHNPGKVAAVVGTAAALQERPHRLVVVFQPHLYSRTADFAQELGAALLPADVVVVMDVYAAREDPVPGVTGELVADAARRCAEAEPGPACEVHYEASWDAVAPLVASLVRPGDLVLTVGAGDVTALGPQVLAILEGAAAS
ncbi:UDP-N-acetylmuramate--L-alanine ligase [Arsenicicoccus sp. oral taxon 190]|uniref:UDP-N-acetylmuramate--L-alanine ligase n=1 Tax=Arsenicicoccus sp. oral taxon 190 TaxID=1658671 RepID=UPI00067A1C53|nr:UDP-N-acetylmuramate--L-alanine ligase [Arsenicicoccus sp. oral taxon 190]AKT51638.1 UDP-N-acetylmuramate--alanine ligase [Arsenicicoccus sp. oral taxon 190]